jgi:hypothetical protein
VDEAHYKKICAACDEVLLSPHATLACTAIPWLHVIREHPSFLKDYEAVLVAPIMLSKLAAHILKRLRFYFSWLKQLYKACNATGAAWHGPQTFSQPSDVLLISHLLDRSKNKNALDFYFGDLPERLRVAGHTVTMAFIDHTGMTTTASTSPIIFSNSLGIKAEISLYQQLKKESRRLSTQARTEPEGLKKRVLKRASLEALSGATRTNLRLHQQFTQLIASLKPKTIITTYEGHAWERLAYAAAHAVSPHIQCTGYQHAAIFRLQHSVRRQLQTAFNPNTILTAGHVAKTQLEDSEQLRGIPIAVLGSHRALNVSHHRQKKNSICLVLPEGLMSECHLLFEFSIACAKLLPNMHFVWRLHPLIAYEKLVRIYPSFRQLPKNIVLSSNAIDADIAVARYALYRGSTAIVQAVCAGVQPIYLVADPSEMSIDPLYQLNEWRQNVSNTQTFKQLVEDREANDSQDDPKKLTAIQYCESFYSPYDSSVVLAHVV